MAISFLHIDGFEHAADPSSSQHRYMTSESTLNAGVTNSGEGAYWYGRALRFWGDAKWLSPILPGTPYTTIFTAYHYLTEYNFTSNKAFLEFRDEAASAAQVTISLQFSFLHNRYIMRVYRGTTGGTLLDTYNTALMPSKVWNHISVMCHIDNSSGRVKVNVDGNTIIDFTGNTQNTANARIDRVRYISAGVNTAEFQRIDNLIIATGSPTDSMLPEIRVHTQFPTGNDSTQFSVSGAASNWAAVNDAPPNSDTSYTYSSTVGHQDTFTFSAPSIGPTVHALQVCYDARRDDAGPRTMRAVVKPTTTAYDSGADDTLTANYYIYKKIWGTNPETSSAWTSAEATAAKFGYKLTT